MAEREEEKKELTAEEQEEAKNTASAEREEAAENKEEAVEKAETPAPSDEGKEKEGTAAEGDTKETPGEEETSPAEGEPAAAEEQPDPSKIIRQLEDELRLKEAIIEEYKRRLLRLQADFDNFRRRTQREKEEMARFAAEGLIVKLLPVLDNLERALAAGETDSTRLLEGVSLIHRQFMEILAAEGVEPIQAVGCPFDPSCHEAVMQVQDDRYPENTVVEELQKGYTLKGKVIRPAMVKVSVQ